MRKRQESTPYLLFSVVLAGLLYLAGSLPFLTMSLDGVIYAGIARDLASGLGSFWSLPYFDSQIVSFRDHPPLGLWFLSLWFEVFGDRLWVERLYCATMAIAIPAAMALLWSRLYPSSPRYSSGIVWAVAIFFLMPVTTHALRSNALELLITLIGILAAVCAWEGKSRARWLAIVAALSAVGFLVKGPVGLFPLAMPFVFAAVVENEVATGFRRSAVSSIICFALLSSLLLYEPARIHFAAYFENQILASLTGLRGSENNRVYLLQHFGLNITVPIFLTLGVFATRRVFSQRESSPTVFSLPSRETIALIAIGLIASVPLLLSPRHYRHYLFPCLPFFALAAATIVHPKVHLKPLWSRLLVLTLLLAVTTRGALNFGLPGKDALMLTSLQVAAGHVFQTGANQLGFCHPDPVRQSYLQRHYRIQSTNRAQTKTPIWFCSKETNPGNTELLAELPDGNVLWRRISPRDL